MSADRAFASALFACLVLTTRSTEWTALCLTTFAASLACMRTYGNGSVPALVAHLASRYVGFWWTWTALRGRPTTHETVVLTGLYGVSCATLRASTRMRLVDWGAVSALVIGLLLLAHPRVRVPGKCVGFYGSVSELE